MDYTFFYNKKRLLKMLLTKVKFVFDHTGNSVNYKLINNIET